MGTKLRAGLVLLFVFSAGVLSGILFEHWRADQPSLGVSPLEAHQAAMAELKETLQLDDEQTAQIHSILAENHQAVQRLWQQFRPQVHEAMQRVHLEIAELLNSDQRQRYHEWLMKRRAEHGESRKVGQRERRRASGRQAF